MPPAKQEQQQTKKVTYLVYGVEQPKSFKGILGQINLYTVHLLLQGGKTLIEEIYNGDDPVEWYTKTLEEQEIYVQASKVQTYKGQTIIWLEVDTTKTPVHEFTSWLELPENDTETLAWHTIHYPCSAETGKECLGLATAAKEIPLQTTKHPLTLQQVLDAVTVQQQP
jgi:hypothetical protein